MKTQNTEPFKENEFLLEGPLDIKYELISMAILFGCLFVPLIILFGIIGGGIVALIATCVYLVIAAISGGLTYIVIYLRYRKAYIQIDKSGISGSGMQERAIGAKTNTYTYSWKEIENIRFERRSMENKIGISTKQETVVYRIPYRMVLHDEAINAIRTFGGAKLLDDENIKTVKNAYSYHSIIINSCLVAAALFAFVLFKLFAASSL